MRLNCVPITLYLIAFNPVINYKFKERENTGQNMIFIYQSKSEHLKKCWKTGPSFENHKKNGQRLLYQILFIWGTRWYTVVALTVKKRMWQQAFLYAIAVERESDI